MPSKVIDKTDKKFLKLLVGSFLCKNAVSQTHPLAIDGSHCPKQTALYSSNVLKLK